MKRRDFIIRTSTIMGSLPLLNLHAFRMNDMMTDKHEFTVGNFKATIFRDLMFKYHAKDYFINASPGELEQAMKTYQIVPDNIPSPFIAILLEGQNKKILIDTGIGFADEPLEFRGNKIPQKGKLVQLLHEAGIKNEDITDVIITHFHPDHIGGVYSSSGQLNFPHAKFHVHEKEWAYWHSAKSDQQLPLFKFFVEKNMTPLSKQDLNLIKGDFTDIVTGIKAVKSKGHTPGQMALIIDSPTSPILYISDAFLHPLHIERIDWQTNYDLDHKDAKRTRVKLLELARNEDMLINAFHFDFPGLGRVEKSNNKWAWKYADK